VGDRATSAVNAGNALSRRLPQGHQNMSDAARTVIETIRQNNTDLYLRIIWGLKIENNLTSEQADLVGEYIHELEEKVRKLLGLTPTLGE
jgi:hypothetical protein